MMSSPKQCQFDRALVAGDWVESPIFSISAAGVITDIRTGASPMVAEIAHHSIEKVDGIAIPGMVNVHSHAFQRSFVGLSEYQTGQHDSFWTWRKLMYDFVLKLSPDDVYFSAKGLYAELLRGGYTWVAEFHYLHRCQDGGNRSDIARFSDALIQAAQDVGIGICFLPVLYQRGGFNNEPLDPAQCRFYMSEAAFLELLSDLCSRWAGTPNVEIGIAFHSLRAVSIDAIRSVAAAFHARKPNGVIHIHVAEQEQEVQACLAKMNKRPVEYLLSNIPVDHRWCLIHATHVSPSEVADIVRQDAIVGLCPTTEANLGDGIFPIESYLNAGGRFAIGSDSHVCTNANSELRCLEYTQRLVQRRRAILGTTSRSVGARLYQDGASGGAAAIGIQAGDLRIGNRADLVILDSRRFQIRTGKVDTQAGFSGESRTERPKEALDGDRILDKYLFDDSANPVMRCMVGGKWVY